MAELVTMDQVKSQLNIPATSSTYDSQLDLYMRAATDVVEQYVGDVDQQTYSEAHDGGSPQIVTYHAPIISVASLAEHWGGLTYNLTLQPPGQTVDPYGFSIDDPAVGRIVRRTSTGLPFPFLPGVGNVMITYTAGLASVPASIQLATLLIVEHLWQTKGGSLPTVLAGDTVTVPGAGYAVPNRAVELLERFERPSGIA